MLAVDHQGHSVNGSRTPDTEGGTARRPASSRLLADLSDQKSQASAIAESDFVAAQVDLRTRRFVAVSAGACALLRIHPEAAIGQPVSDWVEDDTSGALALLATGRLDGFEAGRRLRRADGVTIDSYVWAHVIGDLRPAAYGVAIAASERGGGVALAAPSDDVKVLGTVDDEWRIDRVSREVELLLGYPASDLSGVPILSAVHPNDVADFLSGLAHVHATGRSVTLRLRIRTEQATWLLCQARVSALDRAPRFAFTLRVFVQPATAGDRDQDIRQHLERLVVEIRGAALALSHGVAPTLEQMPRLSSLTAREWEIVTLLADGSRVPTIAKQLSLSPHTVRNHLSAIYQKLEVSSQVELLERLKQSRHAPAQRSRTE
jgi:DNA-binding CsgD family transcriptional regulator/PAS domain-containing protein